MRIGDIAKQIRELRAQVQQLTSKVEQGAASQDIRQRDAFGSLSQSVHEMARETSKLWGLVSRYRRTQQRLVVVQIEQFVFDRCDRNTPWLALASFPVMPAEVQSVFPDAMGLGEILDRAYADVPDLRDSSQLSAWLKRIPSGAALEPDASFCVVAALGAAARLRALMSDDLLVIEDAPWTPSPDEREALQWHASRAVVRPPPVYNLKRFIADGV